MSNLVEIAKEYLESNLSILPTKEDKRPVGSWKPYQTTKIKAEDISYLFTQSEVGGIGIIAGAVSGNLEVIDVDLKHDNTGKVWEDLTTLIEDNLPDLYSKLVIAQTVNKGYHIYYRCSSIAGNLKLANKENREVLIETRGEGGYVVAYPSKGYKFIQGDPKKIVTITPEDREILFSISKSFDELPEKESVKISNNISNVKFDNLSPFEDYNNRGDVIELLQSNGWKVTTQRGEKINLLRPGTTDSKTSGNYHTGLKVLRVFSSSTVFNPDKGYSPAMVFSLLECNEDNKLAYRKLLDLGYGEPFNGEIIKPTAMTTEKIIVTSVNSINRVNSVVSNLGETLKIENIKGDEILITSPGVEATDEVLKAIDFIKESNTNIKIYVKEGDVETREYRFRTDYLFRKYGEIDTKNKGLTDRDIANFMEEIVAIASTLQPIDKAIFVKDFTSVESIIALGITEESIAITVDRITATRDKETQTKDLKELLNKATKLQEKGETAEALELLNNRVKEVKLKDKATEFSSLLIPIKESELRERQSNKPDSLKSGYTIGGEDLSLPAGAITVLSAPTSHGKTTFLVNLALNVAKQYPDKEAYLFSYEEDSDSVLIGALNTYLDNPTLSGNNRTTLKNHFAGVNKTTIEGKDKFFKELIETKRLNIHYSNYSSDTLIEAIRYLHKHAKPGAIFIDYIQLLNLPEGKYKTYSRQEEIKQICIALKDIAVETGLPIILGAQFNREVVNQTQLHATKIGEAGDIERIANLIIGFWNNNFKPLVSNGKGGEANLIESKGCNEPDTIYATVLKNRGGKVGLEEIFSFNGNTGKISNQSKQSNKNIF